MGAAKAGWRIEKDILYPGRVVVPGADGRNLAYEFTPSDLRAICRTGNEKINDSWNVPLVWEHQDIGPDKKAVRLSRAARDREYAKSVFGIVSGFSIRNGTLKAILEGDDPRDLDQFRKVKFVSPEIQWDWTDTDGRTWHGPTVTHLAATPRPVQRHQHAIGTNPDLPHPRLSQASSLAGLVRMSLTSGVCVGAKLRLSLDHYTRPPAGSKAMADENKVPGMPEEKTSAWERIATALALAGIKIGDGKNIKDPEHLADLIEVAAMNSEQGQDLDDEMPEETDEELEAPAGDMDAPPPGASEPPPPPIQMSLEAKKLIGVERERLIARAERLGKTGRVSPAIANALVTDVKKVRLSLTANAELAGTAVEAKIAAYEALDANTAWSKSGRKVEPKKAADGKKGVRMSHTGNRNTKEVEPSRYQEDGEQDADAIADWFLGEEAKG